MKQWMAIGMVGLVLAGCARTSAPGPAGPVPIEADSITYETGPCFGACPVYSVTVSRSGAGFFTGKRFTAAEGERPFRITPEQYDAFAARLAPFRPATGAKRYAPGEAGCEQAATDMPSVDVTWTRAIGDSQSLSYYFGCDIEKNQAMADAIGSAPDVLPLEPLIGEVP